MPAIDYEEVSKSVPDSHLFDLMTDWFVGKLNPELEAQRNHLLALWQKRHETASRIEKDDLRLKRAVSNSAAHIGEIKIFQQKIIAAYGNEVFTKFPIGEVTPDTDPTGAATASPAVPAGEVKQPDEPELQSPTPESVGAGIGDVLGAGLEHPSVAGLDIPEYDQVKDDPDHWKTWKEKAKAKEAEDKETIQRLQRELSASESEKTRLSSHVFNNDLTKSTEYVEKFDKRIEELEIAFVNKCSQAGLTDEQVQNISISANPSGIISESVENESLKLEISGLLSQIRLIQDQGDQWIKTMTSDVDKFKAQEKAEKMIQEQRGREEVIKQAELAALDLRKHNLYGVIFRPNGTAEIDSMIEAVEVNAAKTYLDGNQRDIFTLVLLGSMFGNVFAWWSSERTKRREIEQEMKSMKNLLPGNVLGKHEGNEHVQEQKVDSGLNLGAAKEASSKRLFKR